MFSDNYFERKIGGNPIPGLEKYLTDYHKREKYRLLAPVIKYWQNEATPVLERYSQSMEVAHKWELFPVILEDHNIIFAGSGIISIEGKLIQLPAF